MQSRMIFTGVHLYDGHGGRARHDVAVVVENGMISAVIEQGDVGPGQQVRVNGMAMMPGMTVGHWHGEFADIGPPLFSYGRAGTFIGTEKPPIVLALQAANALRYALHSGVLRVISASCSNDIDAQLKLALADGLIEGADITPCSRHVLTTGDQEDRGHWWANDYGDGLRRIGGNIFVDGPAAVQKAVRQEILRGADIIKTYLDGGHGLEWTSAYRSLLPEEFAALVRTAHERGKRVRVHVTNKESILRCVALGVDILDHCDYIDEECIEAMAKAGTWFVPSPLFGKLASSVARGLPLNPEDPTDRSWLNLVAMLRKADDAGVRIVPGDDYGAQGMAHGLGAYARELVLYVEEFGISPERVIGWATGNGADMALVGQVTGTIEPGKAADLILVAGDPALDMTLLQNPTSNIPLILRAGKPVKNHIGADFAAAG